MGGYLVVFTQAIPDHYCKNPVLETTYNKNETEIKNLSIPSEYNEKCEIIEYSSCEEYNLDWSICDPSSGNFCTDDQLTELSNSINTLDESDQNVLCRNGYVWDNSTYASTAAEDFELVCTPSGVTLQVLTTSINYVGFIVGSFLRYLFGSIEFRIFSKFPDILYTQNFALNTMVDSVFRSDVWKDAPPTGIDISKSRS